MREASDVCVAIIVQRIVGAVPCLVYALYRDSARGTIGFPLDSFVNMPFACGFVRVRARLPRLPSQATRPDRPA